MDAGKYIDPWWKRIGCMRDPGIQTGEESAMSAEIRELREALMSAEKDAARYQWLQKADLTDVDAVFWAASEATKSPGHYENMLDDAIDAAMKEPATREDDLTAAEAAFVELVKARPGCKLGHDQVFGENTYPLWRKPEALGLVECVGSYKWKPTNKGSA